MFNDSWELERRTKKLYRDINAVETSIVNIDSLPDYYCEVYKTDALKSLKLLKTKLKDKLDELENS